MNRSIPELPAVSFLTILVGQNQAEEDDIMPDAVIIFGKAT
jgi:hypothetical protein